MLNFTWGTRLRVRCCAALYVMRTPGLAQKEKAVWPALIKWLASGVGAPSRQAHPHCIEMIKKTVVLTALAVSLFGQQGKKKVAVYVFDDSTVARQSAKLTGEDHSIGQKVVDAIVGKLADSGVLQVAVSQVMQCMSVEQPLK